jgi:hypothetical protein
LFSFTSLKTASGTSTKEIVAKLDILLAKSWVGLASQQLFQLQYHWRSDTLVVFSTLLGEGNHAITSLLRIRDVVLCQFLTVDSLPLSVVSNEDDDLHLMLAVGKPLTHVVS